MSNEANNSDYYDEDDLFENPPGAVDVDLSVTINLGNYQSFKFSLGINEPYSGRDGDTRKDKVDEVFSFIQSKMEEKSSDLARDIQAMIQKAKDA